MRENGSRTRRQFLKDSVTAATAAGVMSTASQMEAKGPATRPAWMIACRDANLKEVGEPDVFAAMGAIGVEGVEATVTPEGKSPGLFGPRDAQPFSIADEDGIKRLGDALAASRKKICAFCLHNHFDERPDDEVACVKMTARAAVKLGVPAIRIDVVPRRIKDEAKFLEFAVGMGRRIVEATKDTNVRFGVENHGGTTNKPEFLRKLFGGIGSKRFGITLDTANFYWFGHPLSKLYDIYTEFAASACHTHCKSIRYPEPEREKQRKMGWEYGKYNCPVYEGDIDFKRVAAILRKANYTGGLCIENESLGKFDKAERGKVLEREAGFLRRIARTS